MSQDIGVIAIFTVYVLIVLALILGWEKSMSYSFRKGGGARRRTKR